jgi:hypothetical protein
VFFLCYQSFLPQEKGEFPACPSNSLLEIKSVVVHFQGKAFNPSHFFGCQFADVGDMRTYTGRENHVS